MLKCVIVPSSGHNYIKWLIADKWKLECKVSFDEEWSRISSWEVRELTKFEGELPVVFASWLLRSPVAGGRFDIPILSSEPGPCRIVGWIRSCWYDRGPLEWGGGIPEEVEE
jgi:hypothetical protein